MSNLNLKSKIFILFFIIFFLPLPVFANLNNKFGIHLAQPHIQDFPAVSDLVNLTGGDWGYITLVIQENDRNLAKWQEIFDKLREHHLIPIIRIATRPEGENWRRPKEDEASGWAKFLNSLNWVVKNRYVILFNEPNHGAEWGGEVDEKNYTKVALVFAKKFKETNPDFFVMLAGLDASAPSSPPVFEDEEIFLGKIIDDSTKIFPQLNSPPDGGSNIQSRQNFVSSSSQNIFEYIDGWASHSYPNPGFAGSPWDSGRGTVRTYQWELGLLRQLGITKRLPVFITETGWKRTPLRQGYAGQASLSENTVANYFKTAFENIWLPDNNVVAVTPFVFDYQSPPFLEFSWKLPGAKASEEQEFYQQYYTVQSMAKVKGEPEIIDRGELGLDFPSRLLAVSSYRFKVRLKNIGQAVWDKKDNYELRIQSSEFKPFEYFSSDIKNITPFQEAEVDLYLKTGNAFGKNKMKIELVRNGKIVLESAEVNFEIEPLPSLTFNVSLLPKLKTGGNDFELQIFDDQENLVFKKSGLKIKGGAGKVEEIQNIIPGKKYRLVVLKPYYLPRQNFIIFKKGENQVGFKPMLPFDFDGDGKLSLNDIRIAIKNPPLLKLLLP